MTALRRGRAKEAARAGANPEGRGYPVPVTHDVGVSGTLAAALARELASAATDLAIAAIADREDSPVTATAVSDARAAMMTSREGAVDYATVQTKGVFPEPRASGRSGASGANESGTRDARGGKIRDRFPAHWRLDRGHRGRDVQW
jgi:hypothetical protein